MNVGRLDHALALGLSDDSCRLLQGCHLQLKLALLAPLLLELVIEGGEANLAIHQIRLGPGNGQKASEHENTRHQHRHVALGPAPPPSRRYDLEITVGTSTRLTSEPWQAAPYADGVDRARHHRSSERKAAGSISRARILALSARGLSSISSDDGRRAPRNTSLPAGSAPHPQGRPGGQVHPPVTAEPNAAFTMRSSPE